MSTVQEFVSLPDFALPVEIIDHILGFLQSDTAALRSCYKSHPLLSQLAEPHLFSHIQLITKEDTGFFYSTSQLTELLAKYPRIANYIRNLEIWLEPDLTTGSNDRWVGAKETSTTILPNLVMLKAITLNARGHAWDEYPESFRLAFSACLRLQSMQDVCIDYVSDFPFEFALNGECKALRSLTVCYGQWKDQTSDNDLSSDTVTGARQGLALKSLHLKKCMGDFLRGFISWFETSCRSQLRSLEFSTTQSADYDLLPKLLTSSANSLTTLNLDLSLLNKNCYVFNNPLVQTDDIISTTISSLPHLSHLTIIGCFMLFAPQENTEQWKIVSPLPLIMKLCSPKTAASTSSLKHLILDVRFYLQSWHWVKTRYLPWSWLSEVICTPLVQLLYDISEWPFDSSGPSSASPMVPLQVELRLARNRAFVPDVPESQFTLRDVPLNLIHFLLSDSQLMQFVGQGRFIMTPSVPTPCFMFPLNI